MRPLLLALLTLSLCGPALAADLAPRSSPCAAVEARALKYARQLFFGLGSAQDRRFYPAWLGNSLGTASFSEMVARTRREAGIQQDYADRSVLPLTPQAAGNVVIAPWLLGDGAGLWHRVQAYVRQPVGVAVCEWGFFVKR